MADVFVLYKWWKTWGTLPVLTWIKAASHYRHGKFEAAQKYYLKGLQKHADHPARFCARLDLAYCLFKNGKLEAAEEQLNLVNSNPKHAREAFLRLARLQLWSGRSLEAAWTVRRALRTVSPDTDLATVFILAVLDNGGPTYLFNEAVDAWSKLSEEQKKNTKLRAACARLRMLKGDYTQGRTELVEIAKLSNAPFEAILLYAQTLFEDGDLNNARLELRRALMQEPNHPRANSLMAELYLKSGPFYSPTYSMQLATHACQKSNWLSAREMHILAEAFYHAEDNATALVMANKAKQAGSRLLGSYSNVKNLERLIAELSLAQSTSNFGKISGA